MLLLFILIEGNNMLKLSSQHLLVQNLQRHIKWGLVRIRLRANILILWVVVINLGSPSLIRGLRLLTFFSIYEDSWSLWSFLISLFLKSCVCCTISHLGVCCFGFVTDKSLNGYQTKKRWIGFYIRFFLLPCEE